MTATPSALPRLPCACASLRRAARAVTQAYSDPLRSTGLHATQFTILQALEKMGEAGQGRLGEILALDATTLSRTLKLLEREHWIAIAPGDDRRERRITLTRKGRAEIARARPLWEGVQARLRAALGNSAWSELFDAADRIARAAQGL